MVLKLFNTLTRKKETFKPIDKNLVKIYTCGPTVYDYAHIGNFRAYICQDILKRYLKYRGFKVKHIMNITDVDDKTINGAMKQGISLKDYTTKYENAFFEDMQTLNIDKAEKFPRATEHIKEMVDIIKILLKKKIAYKSNDKSIYYDISKFKNYGKLSKTKIKGLKSGARVKTDNYDKEEAQDFALWKSYSKADGDVYWETSIGKGRPGWHIECSAMSMKYLSENFDIHAGGIDLVFPHHENEIAQSEPATGKKFVNYWVHNEHLLVNEKKMSKSLGNFFTLRDLLNKGYNSKAIRFLLLSVNYRQQLNFTEEGIIASQNSISRINDFILKLKSIRKGKDNPSIPKLIKKAYVEFEKVMDDDLNISNALAVIFEFMKKINIFIMEEKVSKKNSEEIIKLMFDFNKILGILDRHEVTLSQEIKKLIQKREEARAKKDYKKADEIRNILKNKGIILEDTKEGVRWKIS